MIGTNLKKILAEKGISTKWLAEQTEVSPTHLSYVMTGRRNISFELAEKIADVLGVTLSELVQNDENFNGQTTPSILDQQFPNVIKILRRDGKKITPEKERLIARIIETAIEDE